MPATTILITVFMVITLILFLALFDDVFLAFNSMQEIGVTQAVLSNKNIQREFLYFKFMHFLRHHNAKNT